MMVRWLVAAGIAAALISCSSAPPRRLSATVVSAPDPDRWERAACSRGEYPADLNARAMARARHADIRARLNRSWSPFAVARLESEREAFDARCMAWRTEDARKPILASTMDGARRE
jgi:hypothetical protein